MKIQVLVLVMAASGLTGCDKLSNAASSMFDHKANVKQSLPTEGPSAEPNQNSLIPPPTNPLVQEGTRRNNEAVNLAKSAETMVQGYFFASKPDPATITNEAQIRDRMSQVKGDITIIGWNATQWDADTYLVTYSYANKDQTDKASGWAFEVKLDEKLVRNVLGDPALEKKYGWQMAR